MENMEFTSIDQVDDISSLEEYRVALNAGLTPEEALKVVSKFSRDNARTPMQWNDDENAGFTTGKPWLAANPNYKRINAKSQIHDENSVFSFYKQLIALRKNPVYREAVVYGEFIPEWEDQNNLIAYYRKGEEKTLMVIANFQREGQTVTLPGAYKELLINNYPALAQDGNDLKLNGYQVVILEI